jgi:hypothetical protein
MADSILTRIGVRATKLFGGEKAAERASAYYDDLEKGELGDAAKDAVQANVEIARHWGETIVNAAQAVGTDKGRGK